MFKKWLAFALIVSMILMLTACGGGSGNEPGILEPAGDAAPAPASPARNPDAELVLRLATQNPDANITTRTMRYYAELVAEASGGTIQVDVYPNAQLGAESSVMEQILTGSLDMAPISAAVLSNVVPQAGVFSTPFLFRDMDVVQSVCYDDEFRTAFFDAVRTESGGAEPLGYTSSTGRGVSNSKHPVRTADDLKGLKIRTIGSSIIVDTFTAMGASATSIPYSEVYTALQQGLIDGEDSSVDGAITMKFIEVVNHYTELQYIYQNGILLVSPATWSKLTDAQKTILAECAVKADEYGFSESRLFAPNAYKRAAEEYPDFQIVSDLTDEEYDTFRAAAIPVWDKYKDSIGSEFFDMTLEISAKYER